MDAAAPCLASMASVLSDDEARGRGEVEAARSREVRAILAVIGTYDMAATDIQRVVRGVLARDRIGRFRKGRLLRIGTMQRAGRAYAARKWLYTDAAAAHMRVLRLCCWGRRHGIVITNFSPQVADLRVLAAIVLQNLARRVLASRLVEARRRVFAAVHSATLRIQTFMRMAGVRARYAPQLLDARRARHERQLAAYLRRTIQLPRLQRLEQRAVVDREERLICRMMAERGWTYARCVAELTRRGDCKRGVCDTAHTSPLGFTPCLSDREQAHGKLCNERMVAALDDLTSDSSDRSIDEEPTRVAATLLPVRLVRHHRSAPSLLSSSLQAFEKHLDAQERQAAEAESAASPNETDAAHHRRCLRRRKRQGRSTFSAVLPIRHTTTIPVGDRLHHGVWEPSVPPL